MPDGRVSYTQGWVMLVYDWVSHTQGWVWLFYENPSSSSSWVSLPDGWVRHTHDWVCLANGWVSLNNRFSATPCLGCVAPSRFPGTPDRPGT